MFLLFLGCRAYVISTPKRESLGPPKNEHHVREWTMHELQSYLESYGFRVVKSFDGIQHVRTQFAIAIKKAPEM